MFLLCNCNVTYVKMVVSASHSLLQTKATEFSGIQSTSRFKTRVDYIYLNQKFGNFFRIHRVTQVDTEASDHNIVISEMTY